MNDSLIGRQLANYRIERLIGRGGMATVYYATDIRLNRPAAVKVIDPYYQAKESFTNRFLQEARAVATWRHEHIVQVYHAGEEEGVAYFAMEYIDGMTLEQILSAHTVQGKRLPIPDILRYGYAIASALDYAHKKGVIHRDVKPLNVLVASDGRVVLTDFGIALDTDQGSIGEVFGSPHYIAPEQARRSNAAVPQSDLYSLGVMLYQMLTGVLPFDDPSPTSIALQHIIVPPPSPSQINPKLNKQTEAVLLKALSKDPSDRYPSGLALMKALESALLTLPSQDATHPVHPSIPPTTNDGSDSAVPPLATSLPVSANRPVGWLPWFALVVAFCLLLGTAAAITLSLREDLRAKQIAPTFTFVSTAFNQPSSKLTATSLPNYHSPNLITTNPPSPTGIDSTTLPSQTQQATLAPTSGSTELPTPTLKYTDRRGFKLYYNSSSFYMQQVSGVGDLIAGVTFERLDANDHLLNSFSGNRWAEYSRSSMLNWCYRLDVIGAGNYLNPSECGDRFLATVHLSPENSGVFWTPQQGSQVFRVLWQNEELVRCEIAAGLCEVFLP